ncbi:hypothetical protein QMK33_12365 [Hymenobacter sp. H14-R3]|uniref:hypothetical protein n=1 Tax=Hymenobacter sp. H14-R3 TaxID=3046308 RepID=UPI0024B994F0|nr:hypothetical protein [Hymenobacter sp. H14-R3]MDJ0365948.1 hypothetical protein [Hymenobacter sp. H14-R3]
MLVSLLPVPFADAGRQRQYEAVRAALHAETGAPGTVLLGNLGAFTPIEVDVLVVRPGSVTLVLLTPCAGHLTLPALAHGAWQLGGQPLPGYVGNGNPFVHYQQQLPLALSWLSEQLGLPESELPPCAGIALLDAPLTFGPEVEAQLHSHAAAHDFQLVGNAVRLHGHLRQNSGDEEHILTEDELLEWGEYLGNEPYVPHEGGRPESLLADLPAFLTQKLRQLWRWLGAEDIPADPPYGGGPPDQHLRDQQEQVRLQQLRHELQTELHQQRQEATTREAARTQELTQLRQQLAQAGLSATARRAEQQTTAKLEDELRTARAELAGRNHELDTRIQQLGLLIKQLQTTNKPVQVSAPAQPAAVSPPVATVAARQPAGQAVTQPVAKPRTPSFRRLRQAERWGVVALVLASLGVGTWGVAQLAHPPRPRPATTGVPRTGPTFRAQEEATPNVVYVVDSTLAPTQADTDGASLYSPDKEPADETESSVLTHAPAKPLIDSIVAPATGAPAPSVGPDSAATPSPGP